MPGLGDEDNEPIKVVPLRVLLTGVTLALLAGASAFLLWDLSSGPSSADALLFLLVLVLAGAATALFAQSDLSVRGLRVIERGVFLALTTYLGWTAFAGLRGLLPGGEIEALLSRWNLTLVQFVLLVIAYGTTIPNAWPRAARVIGAMTAVPVVVIAALRLTASGSASLGLIATTGRIAQALSTLLIAAALATVAAYVIDQYLELAGKTRISIRYVLKHRLGIGGMGEVWLGEHNLLTRPAAIKLIRADVIEDRSAEKAQLMLRRFEREARATARLRSPHTVEVYDFGVTGDGTFYYAMEYLEGVNLNTLVKQHGPLPPERVVYLLEQVCQSLAEAHDRGITHRDIKPANIFTCRLGTAHDVVKVLDFGLVKGGEVQRDDDESTDLTLDGEINGTPGYMAPEAIQSGHDPDARADIYALGCVAYYLLTGTPVFEGPPLSVLVDHARSAPEPPSTRMETAPPAALERIVLQCLEKEPGARPQSAAELADALIASCPDAQWGPRHAAMWWRLHLPAASV